MDWTLEIGGPDQVTLVRYLTLACAPALDSAVKD
jgi:hypothetical protein